MEGDREGAADGGVESRVVGAARQVHVRVMTPGAERQRRAALGAVLASSEALASLREVEGSAGGQRSTVEQPQEGRGRPTALRLAFHAVAAAACDCHAAVLRRQALTRRRHVFVGPRHVKHAQRDAFGRL